MAPFLKALRHLFFTFRPLCWLCKFDCCPCSLPLTHVRLWGAEEHTARLNAEAQAADASRRLVVAQEQV